MKYIKIPKKIINHYTYYFNQTMITYKIEVCYIHIQTRIVLIIYCNNIQMTHDCD